MAAPGHYPLQSQTSGPASYPSIQPGQQPPVHPPMSQPPMMSPTKEVNAITMCRLGQECVHDIVQKAQEVFKILAKGIQVREVNEYFINLIVFTHPLLYTCFNSLFNYYFFWGGGGRTINMPISTENSCNM